MKFLTDGVINGFIETGARLSQLNLIAGAAGNVSIRLPDGIGLAITTRGSDLARLRTEDIVAIASDERVLEGSGTPSSELLMHRRIYEARPDVDAVVHTHSIYATVVAALHESIPAFIDELTFVLGGEIKTAAYARPGSEELGDNIVEALGDRAAALLVNHGAIGLGKTLEEAVNVCDLIERAAQMYVFARALGGAKRIPADAIERQYAAYLKKHARKS